MLTQVHDHSSVLGHQNNAARWLKAQGALTYLCCFGLTMHPILTLCHSGFCWLLLLQYQISNYLASAEVPLQLCKQITCVWWFGVNEQELMAWSSKSDLGPLPTPFYSNCRWWHCLPTQARAICPHPSIATVHVLPKEPWDRVFFRTDRIHLLFQISINRVLRNSIPRATIWVLA